MELTPEKEGANGMNNTDQPQPAIPRPDDIQVARQRYEVADLLELFVGSTAKRVYVGALGLCKWCFLRCGSMVMSIPPPPSALYVAMNVA